MLEKNSSVTLTDNEVRCIENGEVPKELAERWGLSIDELRAIVASQNYNLAGGAKVIGDSLSKE